MKRAYIFLLILSMVLTLLPCYSYAADNTVCIPASQYVGLSMANPNAETGEVQILYGGFAAYQCQLGNFQCDTVSLRFRTGTLEAGIIELRVGSPTGELVGQLDSSTLGGTNWVTIIKGDVDLSRNLKDGEILYISNPSSLHTFCEIVFTLNDPNKIRRSFAKLDNIDIFDDIANDENKVAINLMTELGVFSDSEKSFLASTPVTRIELMRMIDKFVNAEQYAGDVTPFTDVSADDVNSKLLSGLYNLGIIRGSTDGNFYPNTFITIDQLASVFVNSLGYGAIPDSNVNALVIANRLKMFEGIDTTDKYISRSEAAKFLYNLLTSDYLTESTISNDGIKYESKSNFLEKISDYYCGNGVVYGNYDTELFGVRDDVNTVLIDGVEYYAGETRAADYLGVRCEFFYLKENEKRTLVAIYPAENTDIHVYKSGADVYFSELTDKRIVVNKNDKEKKYNLTSETAIIYNGIALDRRLSSLVDADDFVGTVTIINNNSDRIIDCVWVDHPYTTVVGGAATGRIYDKFNNTEINCEDGIFTVIKNGRIAKETALKDGDVISVYESANSTGNKLTRIWCENNIVSGEITAISQDAVIINGVEYGVISECESDIFVGLKGDFYLNQYNYIARCLEASNNEYLIGAYLNSGYKTNGLNDGIKIKLLTENNGVVVFDVAEKVILDGVVIKDPKDIYYGKGKFVGMANVTKKTPVLYTVDNNNAITMIDTENYGSENDNDILKKLDDSQEWMTLGGVFVDKNWVYKHPYRNTLKTIALNAENAEEDYTIISEFDADEEFIEGTPYTFGNDSMIAELIISKDYTVLSGAGKEPFVFKGIMQGINENEDYCLYLYGTDSRGEVKYAIVDDSSNSEIISVANSLKPGDLVQVGLTNSKVSKINIIYIPGGIQAKPEGHEAYLYNGLNNTEDIILGSAIYGTVDKIEDGFIRIDCGNGVYRTFKFEGSVVLCDKYSNGKYDMKSGLNLSSVFVGDTVVAYLSYRSIDSLYVYRNAGLN